VEKEFPWLFWPWCMAHRLELAVKDALKSNTFDLIDDILYAFTVVPQLS